eukprot:CAMPEP_0169069608 /NCGR_PEP_ID=MMETSP1015-20121227/4664_1 /TAXON_ID=342587 /ORGANISM="Karlodinium micrum, Strain CCMP2283" /LENGTH=305 /DNA_ID=CAMNT_0009128533 /DNA_START=231 /DNA_END=1145 /DNA_ORIENTATION=+
MAYIEVVAPASTPGAPVFFLDGDEMGNLVEKEGGKDVDTFIAQLDGFVGNSAILPKVFRLPPIKVSWPDGHPTFTWKFILRSGPRGKVVFRQGKLIGGKAEQQKEYINRDGSIDGVQMEFNAKETKFEIEDAMCVALETNTKIGVDLATVIDKTPGMDAKELEGRLMEEGINELKKDEPLILYGADKGKPLVRKEAKPGQEYRWTADGVAWAQSTNQFATTNGPQPDILVSAADLQKCHSILADDFSKKVGKFFVEENIGDKHDLLYTDLDYLLGRKESPHAGARQNEGGTVLAAIIALCGLSQW